jgi:hypothetical protein
LLTEGETALLLVVEVDLEAEALPLFDPLAVLFAFTELLGLPALLADVPPLLTEVDLLADWVALLFEVGVVVAALLIVKGCELLLS